MAKGFLFLSFGRIYRAKGAMRLAESKFLAFLWEKFN